MRSTCRRRASSTGHPGQNWNASHISYDDGRNDGFVRASGPVAMGYWTSDDIPFYYGARADLPALRPLVLLDASRRRIRTAAS